MSGKLFFIRQLFAQEVFYFTNQVRCLHCQNRHSNWKVLTSSKSSFSDLKLQNFSVVPKRELRRKVSSKNSYRKNEHTSGLVDVLLPHESESNMHSKHVKDVIFPTESNRISSEFSVENIDENLVTPQVEEKKKSALDIAIRMRQEKKNRRKTNTKESTSTVEMIENPDDILQVKNAVNALKPTDLAGKTTEELARYLRRNVLYADKNLVVFNKPYGMAVHGGDNLKGHLYECFPILSKLIYGMKSNVSLSLCNRLDKNTTGVTICATNEETKSFIVEKHREKKILRKYLTVVLNEPESAEGMIEIPLKYESFKKGDRTFTRMVLSPEVRYNVPLGKEENISMGKKGQLGITYYKSLASNGGLSLLELQPRTTIKHQLRVHTSDGLGCPILGDHKFSKYGVLGPQSLPIHVVQRFKIPRTKTSNIPMHLHLQQIMIPDIFPDEKKPHLIIGAKIPQHFLRTITLFNLKTVPNVKWIGQLDNRQKIASPKRPNSDLYDDPTVRENDQDSEKEIDLDNESLKVFKPRINVQYKK